MVIIRAAICAGVALAAAGCGARPAIAPGAGAFDELTLYRDRALVQHRVDVVATAAGPTTVALAVAAGVAASDLVVLDRGELVVSQLRIAHAAADEPAHAAAPGPDAAVELGGEPADDPVDHDADAGPEVAAAAPRAVTTTPTELELMVAAPRAGRFTVTLAYATDRITWQAAYTLTADAPRDRAILRGAVAIRNTSGIALRARAYLVDAELGAWRDHATAQLGAALVGADPGASQGPRPRELGQVSLGDGETRVGLLAGEPPRKLRSVLVYDPIGTRLDHPGATPIFDPALGVDPAAPTRVTESFEIERDERATRGLPAGPVRLLERRADGSLAVVGESRLFDPSTRVADVDTVAIGTAGGVTGHRERRDWARDTDQKRFSEELLITIDNARPRPVDIVVREHLYRGQNWTLAYQSAAAVKEGPQQIALRTQVPANGRVKVLYVVVYTW